MKLNNKGFAITAIIYSILVIVIIIITLVLAIISSRRQTIEKVQERVKEQVAAKAESTEPSLFTLYELIENAAKNENKNDKNINFENYSGSISSDYPIANVNNGDGTNSGIFKITREATKVPIYFYRGNAVNNYVVFAEKCWKIVRTTETKGIKMIYSGPANANKCQYQEKETLTARSKYNDTKSSEYSGSIMESTLNTWYNNISIANRANLETFKLCNDTTTDTWNRINNNNPRITICANPKDVYIGLLTADEIMYAGGMRIVAESKTGVRLNYFLRIDQPVVTSGVTYLNLLYATSSTGEKIGDIIYVGGEGQLSNVNADYNTAKYPGFVVRPVISLKSGIVPSKGVGTATNPYIIS